MLSLFFFNDIIWQILFLSTKDSKMIIQLDNKVIYFLTTKLYSYRGWLGRKPKIPNYEQSFMRALLQQKAKCRKNRLACVFYAFADRMKVFYGGHEKRNIMNDSRQLHAVWAKTAENKNIELCFSCSVGQSKSTEMEWIAKDTYNLYVNGKFVAYGPSRAAKGYSRMDRMDLTGYLTERENRIQVYVQANGTTSLCSAKEQPLFAAQIWQDGALIRQTGEFRCYHMTDKQTRVERMSSQRGFLEVYDMHIDRFSAPEGTFPRLEMQDVACPKLLRRRVSFSKNREIVASLLKTGRAYADSERVWENDFTRLLDSGERLDAYKRQDCSCVLSKELLRFRLTDEKPDDMGYALYAIPQVHSGKLCVQLSCKEKCTVWLTYDDVLMDGQVKFNREHIIHGMKWTLAPGEYTLYSQEVYSAKCIQLVMQGQAQVSSVSMITIENPDAAVPAVHPISEKLQAVLAASCNTFAQNAYDIFTDCPSRERAGWLCDSYFLGKAERFFTGENKVEKSFLENYLLYENQVFPHAGIMPMCYPSEVSSQNGYIPNWILWYLLELEDYKKRTGDVPFIERHRQRILDILDFFRGYENELGLLENLQGWVFIEWSQATDFVDGINFPTNMLYADALRAAGTILDDPALLEKSVRLKKTVVKMSFNGTVFIDNALRVDGRIVLTDHCSELCQIFAQYFGLSPDSNAFTENFYSRFVRCGHTVCPSALFIGGILRLMCLYNMERYDLVLQECEERFFPMAERTGTIWEFFDEQASCNHGFGSVIGMLIANSVEMLAKGGKKNEAS